MAAESLCRCICGPGIKETEATTSFDPLSEVEEPSFPAPQVVGRLSYTINADQPLRGVAIREGRLWYLSTEDKVDPVSFSLFINGFSFALEEQEELETTVSLSPFALVRNCKFQSAYPTVNLADFKIFKVSLFCQGVCFYFGVRGEDERQVDEERSRWVLDISRAMRMVTQSLFPPYSISCEPLPSVACTQRRLMAGYLVHHDQDDELIASVLYCELHPHCEDKAKLVLYENEVCQTPVMDVYITERSLCCEKIGINCSCFSIEEHQFSTRTLAERKLWLRAILNLKVKLQNHAPSPAGEDLRNYRLAIKEHIGTVMKGSLDCPSPSDALLQRALRKQIVSMPPGIWDKTLSGTRFPEPPAAVALTPTAPAPDPERIAAVPAAEELCACAQEAPEAVEAAEAAESVVGESTPAGAQAKLTETPQSLGTLNEEASESIGAEGIPGRAAQEGGGHLAEDASQMTVDPCETERLEPGNL